MSKYNNVKTTIDGHVFDSKHEAQRYGELVALLNSGWIVDLILQPVFLITVKDCRICKYIADFSYFTNNGHFVVEDAKGIRTPVYRLKKKLVKALYGIDIMEV
jgi:hypothetical protein